MQPKVDETTNCSHLNCRTSVKQKRYRVNPFAEFYIVDKEFREGDWGTSPLILANALGGDLKFTGMKIVSILSHILNFRSVRSRRRIDHLKVLTVYIGLGLGLVLEG